MSVRFAEKFDEKAEKPISHQVKAWNLVVEFRNLAKVVQYNEQDDAFEQHFVKLAWVVEDWICKSAVVGQRKVHADRTCCHFAEKFTVDEVAVTAPGVGEWCGEHGQV